MLSVSTTTGREAAAGVIFTRKSRDFTRRDRLVLSLLRPHIAQACRNAEMTIPERDVQALSDFPGRQRAIFGLSSREAEVAQWLAEGKTNPEIGVILNASPRTIEKHMETILFKLRVENRTAAAAVLIKTELTTGRMTSAREA